MSHRVYISSSPSEQTGGLSFIKEITPEIIPHEEFHRVSWLRARKNPIWYYYAKRNHGNVITNKFFLSSVDESLREFVKFLHKKNIFTTPSCSGHNKSVKEFEKIYAALKEDKKKINKKGLWLQDIETGARVLFHDINYRLPWTQNEFILNVMQQQEKGIIGLRLNGNLMAKEKIINLRFPGTHIYEKDNIVFIQTQNSIRWDDLIPAVKKIIQECSSTIIV